MYENVASQSRRAREGPSRGRKMSFKLDRTVYLSLCDHSGRLSPYSAASLVQDNVTEMLTAEGVPSSYLLENFGAAWVVLQTDSIYLRLPGLDEKLSVETFTSAKTAARYYCDTVIRDASGEICTCTRVTMCALEMAKARPMRLRTAIGDKLPIEPVVIDPVIELSDTVTGEEDLGSFRILSTDLDFLRHANNVECIRLALSKYGSEELDGKRFRGLRATYKAQDREGETINVKRVFFPGAERIVFMKGEEVCDEFTFFLGN
jgi:acyl-CoA thioesterase FadM